MPKEKQGFPTAESEIERGGENGDEIRAAHKDDVIGHTTTAAPLARPKKKKAKKKNKTAKAELRGTGFEYYYADSPVPPAQWEEERRDYAPSRDFTLRLESCLARYNKQRYFDNERARFSQIFLNFAKISKIKSQNLKLKEAKARGEGNKAESELEPETPSRRSITKTPVEYDSVQSNEEWILRARKFFAHHLPLILCREKPWETIITAIDVVENFMRYLMHHDIFPEFIPAILKTMEYARMARTEFPRLHKAAMLMPGRFNIAVSATYGGGFIFYNRDLLDKHRAQVAADAEREALAAEAAAAQDESGDKTVSQDTNSETSEHIKLPTTAKLFEVTPDGGAGAASFTDVLSEAVAAAAAAESDTQNIRIIEDNSTKSKKTEEERQAREAYQRRLEEWEDSAAEVPKYVEADFEIEFQEEHAQEVDISWEEHQATVMAKIDARHPNYRREMSLDEAHAIVAQELYGNTSAAAIEKVVKSQGFIESAPMPVEVVAVYPPPAKSPHLMGHIVVRPWWYETGVKLQHPEDCPFAEDEDIKITVERELADAMYPHMLFEATFRRLENGRVVFDQVASVMCSFYIASSLNGD
ncbi:Argonaute siRNA chaperone complex subunit Arb1-domain-containing protein [Limtongia smithiae]|uniref:Argonaute siRNA chaperone complex subunit Arb1-domain-containing protein n=1 Tax=Limtongia smithiae TaxID=1125753 RepID=UPI0034CF6CCA